MNKPIRYLIWHKPSQNTAGVATWWRPDRSGYTFDIDQAGRYDELEMRAIIKMRPGEDIALEEPLIIAARRSVVFDDALFAITTKPKGGSC